MDHHSSQVLLEQLRRFQFALEHIPENIRTLRLNFAILMAFSSLARYVAQVQRKGFDVARHELVVQELIAAVAAVLDFREEPVSE